MEQRYATPGELVEALQTRGPGARAQLWHVLHEPVDRMMGELVRRHGLDEDRRILTLHALHLIETSLRVRPAASFAGLGWNAFRATVLLQLAKIVHQPHGQTAGGGTGPPPLPDCPAYHSDAFSRPYTRVGNHFFGGDWYAGRAGDDGSLWVIVADVTGHGYFAYLLASSLPAVWQRCWNEPPEQALQPADLLAAMHDLLEDCLPEGVFLECTLVRLDESGQATVSPAGGSRLLLGRQRRSVDLVKLRGAWLGLRAPTPEEQHCLELGPGDELVLATDGVYDQLEDLGGIGNLAGEGQAPRGSLFEAVRAWLERALQSGPQKDDITLVLLRRRHPANGSETLPLPLRPGEARGGDHVPV
jgi:hypothetical protein